MIHVITHPSSCTNMMKCPPGCPSRGENFVKCSLQCSAPAQNVMKSCLGSLASHSQESRDSCTWDLAFGAVSSVTVMIIIGALC